MRILTDIIKNFNKQKFSSKSEQTKEYKQLSLFNEVEIEADTTISDELEEPIVEVKKK